MTTAKLGLKLPQETDFYDVQDFNDNFNTIDNALNAVNSSLDTVNNSLGTINNNITAANNSINTVNNNLSNSIAAINNNLNTFRGVIVMWSGTVDTVPAGWALCDGNNATPNLLDRFIVCAGGHYGVGNTGGLNAVGLSSEHTPPHNHFLRQQSISGQSEDGVMRIVPQSIQTTNNIRDGVNVQIHGEGQPHENRPPYCALAYIMKL